MKRKFVAVSLVVLALSMPVAMIANAQEATEEAPAVEDGRGHPIREILREVMDIVTEATGLTQAEIVEQLQAGSTLSEIITANGSDVEAIKVQVITLVTERIETAVAAGNLTRERADLMLANLADRVDQIFDEVHDLSGRPFNMAEHGLFAYLVQAISDATGLTVQEIAQQVQDGSSLSDVITSNGGDVEVIKSAALAEATANLDERVANGELTQEEADALLVIAADDINGWISGELEFPRFGGEGRGGRDGGRGGMGQGHGGMGGNGPQGDNQGNGQGN